MAKNVFYEIIIVLCYVVLENSHWTMWTSNCFTILTQKRQCLMGPQSSEAPLNVFTVRKFTFMTQLSSFLLRNYDPFNRNFLTSGESSWSYWIPYKVNQMIKVIVNSYQSQAVQVLFYYLLNSIRRISSVLIDGLTSSLTLEAYF